MNQSNTVEKSGSYSSTSSVATTQLTGRWVPIARIVWLVLVAPSVVLFVVSLVVSYQQLKIGAIPAQDQELFTAIGLPVSKFNILNTIFNVLTSAIWYGVGFLIFWRRSDDWLALLAAFVLVMFNVGPWSNNNAPSVLALIYPAFTLPFSFISFLADCSLGLFLLLFPNGRLVPRWMGLILLLLIISDVLVDFPSSLSPFAAHWPAWLVLPSILVFCGAIIYSQIYRYRHVSTPAQRQQTKWVALGLTVALAVITVILAVTLLVPFGSASPFLEFLVTAIIWPAALLLIPLFIGFSILRYRLYDIDLLINRTLVYGTLTVLLGLIYFGLIVSLQYLLREIISQNNDVAIVVSTLAIAALFQPLRHRIQTIIDRRFYRRKYDAAKVVAAFSTTLRQEVDLDQLREHLITVVQDTMQPSHISLWLREPASKRPRPNRTEP
jgi:hypothetical protein